MSYFADSAWDYIAKKISGVRQGGQGRRLLLTMPRLPEEATLVLADTFASKSLPYDVSLTFKIAQVVWSGWTDKGKARAQQHGWLDDSGSLTAWRNQASAPGRTSLVVLCGADVVTDAGGLSDFHLCDLDTIWNIQMRRGFRAWMTQKLNTVGLGGEGAELR